MFRPKNYGVIFGAPTLLYPNPSADPLHSTILHHLCTYRIPSLLSAAPWSPTPLAKNTSFPDLPPHFPSWPFRVWSEKGSRVSLVKGKSSHVTPKLKPPRVSVHQEQEGPALSGPSSQSGLNSGYACTHSLCSRQTHCPPSDSNTSGPHLSQGLALPHS